jgi:hypothetical protein
MTMTALELSFQFPIKREGASPVVGAAASVAAGVSAGAAESLGAGSADSDTAGTGAGASSVLLFEFPITITPTRRIPTRTTKRTFDDEPLLGEAFGALAGFAAAARGAFGAGVVETFTREPPESGTGGITTLDAEDFLAADFLAADFFTAFFAVFLTAFLAALFLTADFFAVFFLAAVFFTADFFAVFFAALFFAGDFLTVFLAADFLTADFFAAVFFFTATWISLSY